MQNFNSLGYSVLEISVFQYEACHGFRAGGSVHKIFCGRCIGSGPAAESMDAAGNVEKY